MVELKKLAGKLAMVRFVTLVGLLMCCNAMSSSIAWGELGFQSCHLDMDYSPSCTQ